MTSTAEAGWTSRSRPSAAAAVDPASLFDTASEITITTSTGATLTVLGRPVLVDAATSRYRFFFTGHTDGNLVVTFVDDGWTNLFGTRWSSQSRVVDSVTVGPFAAPTVEADVSAGTVTPRTWFDVVFTPVPGATLDVASILAGGQITFSGAGSEGLTAVSVLQVDATTFRYLYTGTLQTGTVTATFVAGSWRDSAGNLGAAGTSSFRLITQGTSFFIEISGGILLEAAGLTDEPLLDLKAEVVLEIDTARSLFKLTFVGQLSIIKLGTVGATAGVFVLDMGDGLTQAPQFWGVATLETNFSALRPLGLDMFAKGTLQINLTGSTKVETLTLPGLGEGGTDLVRTFTLNPYSFAVEVLGQAIVRVPNTTTELLRVQGGIFLSIEASTEPRFTLYVTGELSFGSGDARLTYGKVTGLLLLGTDGIAGTFTVAAGGGLGHPRRRQHLQRDRHRHGDVQLDAEGQDLPGPRLLPAAPAAGRAHDDHHLQVRPRSRRPAQPVGPGLR